MSFNSRLQTISACAGIISAAIAFFSWTPTILGKEWSTILADVISPKKSESEGTPAPLARATPAPLDPPPQPREAGEAQRLAEYYAAREAEEAERQRGEDWARQRKFKRLEDCDDTTGPFREGCLDWIRTQAS